MAKYSVLVVGAGGRESALIHAYSKSSKVSALYAVPGNDLMQDLTKKSVHTFPSLKTTGTQQILEIVRKNNITLVDIAQDNAVEAGLGDLLLKEKILHIGPTRNAGQLEWDKGWARTFMQDQNILHPSFVVCHSAKDGCEYLEKHPDQKWVIKASGLAEGKGVLLVDNTKDAKKAINEMQHYGKAGETFLIEQMIVGEEFSCFAVSDGKQYQVVGSAQDHKRVNEFDEGLNTGGMGASTPPLLLNSKIIKNLRSSIFDKTFKGMQKLGRPYKGVLYLGGMLVEKNPHVIEFNARWGDPEAQVLVASILNDFFEVSMAVAQGDISKLHIKTDGKARVAVAGVSRGYPDNYLAVKGKKIFGIEEARKIKGVTIYGAGIKKINGKNYAAGGRLFYVVGEGKTVLEAREKAYQAMSMISVEGNNLHYRTDIGWRDVERLRK